MKFAPISLVVAFVVLPTLLANAQSDWSVWRGPNRNGIAAVGEKPPVEWSADKNIVWRTKVPGRGHSSPAVVGKKIFLTTADKADQTQSVICYDRETGKQLWIKQINQGGFTSRIHSKNTHASPSISSDGERVFVVFNINNTAQVTALDLDGEVVWQKTAAKFQADYPFGFGASPLVYDGTVFVTSESSKEPVIVCYDAKTGTEKFRINRGKSTSYSTPVVAEVSGKTQLLISGINAVTSYNPQDGRKLWSSPAIWQVTCGTIVWNDDMVFASGGYPRSQTIAVAADGSGKVAWQNNIKCYEQSMIVIDDAVYGLSEGGVAYCWDAKTGEELWKERMEGPESASPVFAGGHLYFTSEKGNTFVLKPNRKKMDLVAKNKLGDSAFASLAVVDNQLFTRVGKYNDGQIQEYLICIGEK